MAGGVAVFDYNNDGRPDLYFVNGARSPRWISRTALIRTASTGTTAMEPLPMSRAAGVAGAGFATGVAAADYNNDGWEDLFIAGVNRNLLYRNRGDGTFEDVTTRAGLAADGAGTLVCLRRLVRL